MEPMNKCPDGARNGKAVWKEIKYACFEKNSDGAREALLSVEFGWELNLQPSTTKNIDNQLIPLTCIQD